MATTNDLYTTVKNISGKTLTFSYLGKHGKTLANNATMTIWGHIQHSFGHGEVAIRKKRALEADLLADPPRLTILSTPRPLLYDASADPAVANPTVQATIDPDGGGATLANPTVQATGVADGGGATGGLLAAGTYKVAYTFVHPNGETTVGTSASADIVVSATNIPRITLPALPADATSIKLYVTDDGGVVGTLKLYASGITTTTYDMAIAAPAGAAPPVANTTAGALAAGTFYLTYTFVNAWGETLIGTSRSAQFTVAAGEIPRVTLPALPTHITSINVYLTNTNGASGTEKLYKTGVTTTTTDLLLATYNGGTYAASSAMPTENTAEAASVRGLGVVDNVLGTVDPSMERFVG